MSKINFFLKIKDGLFKDGKKRNTIITVCIAVILLIIVLCSVPSADKTVLSEDKVLNYLSETESKLKSLLNKVNGAGKVDVAISVESGMETVLAMNVTVKETDSGKETVSAPVLVNGKTVTVKELYPKITGVLIIAEGAKNIAVYNNILQATVSFLSVKPSQIEILAMK